MNDTNPIIFLDVDGVLNTLPWMKGIKSRRTIVLPTRRRSWLEMLDPSLVANLNLIVEKTGADIVVSSTWRLTHDAAAMQSLLDEAGFEGTVIDITGDRYDTRIWDGHSWNLPERTEDVRRGRVIHWWLHQHPNVKRFVIIDDDSDMEPLLHRHVKTHYMHWDRYPEGELGLGPKAVEKAIELCACD